MISNITEGPYKGPTGKVREENVKDLSVIINEKLEFRDHTLIS